MPLFRRVLSSTVVLCTLLALALPVPAQDGSPTGKCGFQNLTIHSPAGTTATPTALSDKGSIVGFYGQGTAPNFHTTGFLVSEGKFTSFSFPGARDTLARDINRNGLIVGSWDTPTSDGQRAFTAQNGVFHEVRLPGFPAGRTVAAGVNDLGDIVGSFNDAGSNVGFLLHKGKLTIISFPGARGGTFASSINNQGVVVGTFHLADEETVDHGFMWKNGAFTNIQVPGAKSTTPTRINNNGDIVGTFLDANFDQHGFSLDNGTYKTIDHPGGTSTQLFGLNNFDNVLGAYITTKNVLFKGFCSSEF